MNLKFESVQTTVIVRRIVRGTFQNVTYYAQLHGYKQRQLNNDKFQLTKEVPFDEYTSE